MHQQDWTLMKLIFLENPLARVPSVLFTEEPTGMIIINDY